MKRLFFAFLLAFFAITPASAANFYWKATTTDLNAIAAPSAGDRGIVITDAGAVSYWLYNGSAWVAASNVTAANKQDYDANMISWPSTISATEVGYLDGLTEALSTSLSGKQPTMTAASQAEMEAGTESAIRSMSPLRIFQAIDAWNLVGHAMLIDNAAGFDPSATDYKLGYDSTSNTLRMGDEDGASYKTWAPLDDAATNGDTTKVWSADKVYDLLALKAPLDSPTFTTTLGLPAALTNAAATTWTALDNNASAFSIGSTGKADIFKVITTDSGEGVSMSGTLAVTGAATGSSLKLTGNITGLMPAVVLTHASGVHDGSDDASVMTDSGESFTTSSMVGMTVYNVTDGSSCTVTANDGTTITCTLAGGTDNNWDTNDVWQVGPGPSQSGSAFYVSLASTIRHPATAGYQAAYYVDGAVTLTIEVADAMTIVGATASAVDAGDTIDSPATAGSFICLHNKSATSANTWGKNGTWTDGGAS